MALGGQPLPAPEAAGPLVLAPGQRADLIVDVVSGEGEEAFLVSREREHSDALAAFPVRGRRAGPRGLDRDRDLHRQISPQAPADLSERERLQNREGQAPLPQPAQAVPDRPEQCRRDGSSR